MFKLPDWCYLKLPSSYKLWFILWIIWFTTLWILSSGNPEIKDAPKIPHLDKVIHFCYFMAGGFFFANFLYIKNSPRWSWKKIIIISFIAGTATGALDEYHQSHTRGRQGNDLGDWIADMSGTLAGAYYCYFMWRRIKKSRSVSTS